MLCMGGGKISIRDFYYEYRAEVAFGLVLSALVVLSYVLSPLIPFDTYRTIIMPVQYTAIITFCAGNAYFFFKHHEKKRIRIWMVYIMATWAILTFIGLWVKLSNENIDVAEGVFSMYGWEFVIGDIMGWMLLAYPTELLRPGWLNYKRALLQIAPIIVIGFIDWWLDIDLRWLLAIYLLILLIWLIRHIRAYRKWCEDNFASMENIDVQWIVRYLTMVFIIGISYTYLCFANEPTSPFTQLWLQFFVLFYSTEKILFRPDPWENIQTAAAGQQNEVKEIMTENTALFHEKLENWMQTEKPYLNKDFRLTDLAQILPLNRTYLSQFINNEFGCTFYQYVTNYRIEEAKRIMQQNPELKVQDISDRCGFSSPTVFGRTFARETGCAPSEWTEQFENS